MLITILFVVSIIGLVGNLLYTLRLKAAIGHAPPSPAALLAEDAEAAHSELAPDLSIGASEPTSAKICVIVPAYNESANVEGCLTSILNSTSLSAEVLEVWLTDDQSTDATWAIATSLQQRLADLRLKLLQAKPRPEGEIWVGKNWACTQAAEAVSGEFLLFLDADVRVQQGAIEAAMHLVEQKQIDLLSCGPTVVCGCLAEWLVQPLMMSAIMMSFKGDEINQPESEVAFAAGPFMLFRRSAYDAIGGHRAVADQVVEDIELARRVKSSGLRLRFVVGTDWIAVRMYQSWSALWEGWTKNIYLGSQRDLGGTIFFAIAMLLIFAVPWMVLLLLTLHLAISGLNWLGWVAIALSLVTIGLHYYLRHVIGQQAQLSTRYWWLTGVGGVLVAAIVIGSIIKTETGWGWTWRGRPLKVSS